MLVVEDVVTTGGSVKEVLGLLEATEARIVGVGALIDRTSAGSAPDFEVPLRALMRLEAAAWEQADCPLCVRQEPLTDPGSSRTAARSSGPGTGA